MLICWLPVRWILRASAQGFGFVPNVKLCACLVNPPYLHSAKQRMESGKGVSIETPAFMLQTLFSWVKSIEQGFQAMWKWLFSHESVIWIIIWIGHFELRSVHTREVIAIFELRSVHTRDRIWDFAFQREKNVWVPCQSNMHGARISCTSVHMQRSVYRRKWLEGHLAPPPPPQITI